MNESIEELCRCSICYELCFGTLMYMPCGNHITCFYCLHGWLNSILASREGQLQLSYDTGFDTSKLHVWCPICKKDAGSCKVNYQLSGIEFLNEKHYSTICTLMNTISSPSQSEQSTMGSGISLCEHKTRRC